MDIFDIETASKDELIKHAMDMFKAELNPRDRPRDLRTQVAALYEGKGKGNGDKPVATPASDDEDYEYCLNPKNKRVLIAAPGMKRLVKQGELVPCDKDGNRL
ncbi:hypothetical protein [Salinisphaera sp. G21_0]|uniref:hypothetical protein n=1 Tax=Salinisphaera sp. G21_0 TaxID=2821094 RepID=UPI001ADC9E9D|nr:hypothetical protein [Salinisphaera sp. G21_0]MBO9483794.1 hypothetical protein [Salinisphaera sp. G21_0]